MGRVMIVDDDDGFRESLGAALSLEGFGVECAVHGRDALDRLARSEPPKVLIVDLMMPVMNGWQLLQALRENPSLAAIPIVVVSAARATGQMPPSIRVIPKPVDLFELLALLDRLAVCDHCARCRRRRPAD